MKFVWNDSDADIGHYRCKLIDDDETTLEEIHFTDYTNEWQQKDGRKNHYPRAYSFEVGYCCGFSMNKGFDYDDDYYDRADEDGFRLGGYNGTCTHTVEDIKHWCEEYLAGFYIRGYRNMIKELDDAKRRSEWFLEHGYTGLKGEEDD